MVKVVALSCTFSDSGENRISAVLCRNVSDQFLNQDRLSYAGTAEQSNLSAFLVRA